MNDDTTESPYGTYETESRGYIPEIAKIAPGIVETADRIKVAGEDWITSISRAMGQVAMADYQRRLLNVQLDRARQGLPPLNAAQYGATVNVEAPQLNFLLLAGLGLAAVLLLRRR
jgi:hypothetical protein